MAENASMGLVRPDISPWQNAAVLFKNHHGVNHHHQTLLQTCETQPVQYSPYGTHSQGFLLPGNRTGPASAAMAWRLWKVEPIRSQSFVPIFGAFGPNERWWMRPPDLLTMKRWSGAILLAHLAALLTGLAYGWSRGVESEQVVSPRSG